MKEGSVFETHKTPDLDGITAIALKIDTDKINDYMVIFTEKGDMPENANLFENVIVVDRGRGKYDHHGHHDIRTSAEIVAKESGIDINAHMFYLLKIVENNDARGHSDPFGIGDIIKRIAHTLKDDNETIKIGLRIVRDVIDFKQLEIAGEIQRDHEFAMSVIRQFMKSRKFQGERLQEYYKLLENPNFVRLFDFCEMITAEKYLNGAREARKFGLKVLTLVIKQDRNFNKALKELEDPKITKIYQVPQSNSLIIVTVSSNPEINRAARWKWKTVALVIQKNPEIGGVQIFPNKKWLKDINIVMDNLVAAIRLEEQILSGNKKLTTNYETLKKPERLPWIPEWYYTGKRGFFLLNRSLTATDAEDIPETRISLERIAKIAQIILAYRRKFNFQVYAAKRLSNAH